MIEINDLSLTFSGGGKGTKDEGAEFNAVQNVSLNIPDGCVYGFLGSNGAGKSTIMRVLCGIYKPTSGSVKIDGDEVYDCAEAKSKIFFVNDETVQYSSFTLDALRKYYKAYYKDFSDETFERLRAKLDLPMKKRMGDFSKGMKRQALVIIGLASRTKYLMLDEAFDGLDPAMRKMIKNMIIDEIYDRQATLIVSSHNIAEINELCDRAMLIHKGKLIFSDEIDEIRSGFVKLQLADKKRIVSKQELEALGLSVMQYSQTGSIVQAVVRGENERAVNSLVEGLGCDICETIPLTLEEIFIYELEARGYGGEVDIISED